MSGTINCPDSTRERGEQPVEEEAGQDLWTDEEIVFLLVYIKDIGDS